MALPHAPGSAEASPESPDAAEAATIPTPGPRELVTQAVDANPLGFLSGLIDRYGDASCYKTKFGSVFVFVHPEHVQTILHRDNYKRSSLFKMMLGNGLLASDGPFWKSQRRLMQKDFLPPAVAPFVSIMTQETRRTARDWELTAARNESVDITAAMTELTLRIVVRALFSDDLNEASLRSLCGAVTQTVTNLGKISWAIFGTAVQLGPNSSANFAGGKDVVDRICYDMIAARRSRPAAERPRDLLTMLIEADTDTGPLSDRQLRDEVVTMLVGGHETTALALAWAWKLLADHPEVADRMCREVDTVLAGREPTAADLQKLTYVKAVFQETMRLYPPVWYMARVATEDDVVDGHFVPRGASVLVSAWFTHRHKDFWPDPEQFDPNRFINRPVVAAHRYAYFPFGGGRHQCMGMHFSMLEGVQILAQLSQQFRVHPLQDQVIRPDPGITLRQTPLMRATLTPRPAASI